MPASPIADFVSSQPGFADALGLCVGSLRRMAEYELDDTVNRRMQCLGERKEFLNNEEHAELISLIEFSERRTREKLDAQLALKRLGALLPDLADR